MRDLHAQPTQVVERAAQRALRLRHEGRSPRSPRRHAARRLGLCRAPLLGAPQQRSAQPYREALLAERRAEVTLRAEEQVSARVGE